MTVPILEYEYTTTNLQLHPQFRGKPYQCGLCHKWFQMPVVPVSCNVQHGPHECCHYGEQEVEAPDEPLSWWEQLTSAVASWMGWY